MQFDRQIWENELTNTLKIAKNDGVFLYPTDTIWGLGCMATSLEAIDKIYEIKKRPVDKKFILLFSDENMLAQYSNISIQDWKKHVVNDLEPTTYIIKTQMKLPKILSSDDGFWAVRIVKNEFCEQLCQKLNTPIVSTSANTSGNKNPFNFSDIELEIKQKVDKIVDFSLDIGTGKASTIYKIENNLKIKIR